jgi:glycosyltransferase involved in cell wall biosynthesis
MTISGADEPIALIGPHPPFRGGIAHFTERVSSGLQDAGHDVLAVTFSRLYPDRFFPGKSQYEETDRGNTTAYPILDSINPLSWSKTANLIIEKGARTAIFMYWMPFFAPAYRAIARRLRKRGVRIIGVVHNAIPHERHVGDRAFSKRFIQSCDAVIVLSESVRKDVLKLVPEISVRIQQHPVYDQFGTAIEKSVARSRLNLDSQGHVLLFFGFIRRYKGLHVLLDSLSRVTQRYPGLTLLVAGEFYDDISSYQEQLARLGLRDNVRLEDRYISSGEVGTYFCASDVIVQPYLTATQSGVIPIARHFNKPVIATNVGGLAELNGQNHTVVPAGDPNALADAILSSLSHKPVELHSDRAARDTPSPTWDSFVYGLLEEEIKMDD